MRNKLFIILLMFFAFQLSAEKLEVLKPSKATLTMKAGDMEVWLEKKENNIWEMGSLVDGGRVFQRKEVSIFELKEDSVIPLEHKMSMKILFKKIKASARFNWENLTLDYGEGKDKGSLKLIDGTLGPATAQLKMRLDLRSMDINALPEKIKYVVYYRGEIQSLIHI